MCPNKLAEKSMMRYALRMNTSVASEILQRHFENRKKRRADYSLRAFARDLEISPSFLSQIISKQKYLSIKKALQIAQALKLNSKDKEYFIAEAKLVSTKKTSQEKEATHDLLRIKKARAANFIDQDEFTLVSEWYHFAIFQTLFLKKYQKGCTELGETIYLSRFLKLSPDAVKQALNRLTRMKLIEPSRDKTCHVPLVDQITTENEIPSHAIRNYHRQMLEKAKIAIEAQAIHERLLTTTTLTIRKSDLAEIQQEYQKFSQRMIHQFSKKADDQEEADSVYAIATQIFSLGHL